MNQKCEWVMKHSLHHFACHFIVPIKTNTNKKNENNIHYVGVGIFTTKPQN